LQERDGPSIKWIEKFRGVDVDKSETNKREEKKGRQKQVKESVWQLILFLLSLYR